MDFVGGFNMRMLDEDAFSILFEKFLWIFV